MQKILLLGCVLVVCTGCMHKRQEVLEETYVHRYGLEVSPQDWKQRGENGQVITTRRDGVTVTKCYENGKLNGVVTYSWPHSELIQRSEEYSFDTLVREMEHYPSGIPSSETKHHSDQSYTISKWYESGAPWIVEEYLGECLISGAYYNKESKLESKIDHGFGERLQRDRFGNLLSRDQFEEGYLTLVTTYHPCGTPKEVTPYVKNVVEGTRRSYLPDGEPNTIEQWYAGLQSGITTLFQNGEKIVEIQYMGGVKEGLELRFASDGTIVEEITWFDGVKHGPYHTFSGEKKQTDWYHNGKRVSKGSFEIMERPRKQQS